MNNQDTKTYAVYNEILGFMKSGEKTLLDLQVFLDTEINCVRSRMNNLIKLGFVKGEKKLQGKFKQMTWHYIALRDFYPLDEYEAMLKARLAARNPYRTKNNPDVEQVNKSTVTPESKNTPDRVIKKGNVTTYNLSHHDNYSHRRAPVKPTIGAGSMSMF